MPGSWKTVRVFLSSTFRDMHAERDHLVKVTFPALREKLLPYRVELYEVDLRWGITRDQAENEQVLALCLELIEECQIFFGFLGERYGWVPEHYPEQILHHFPWISQLGSAPRVSATELEILHAVLRHPAEAAKPALLCFRDTRATDAIPEPTRSRVYFESCPQRQAQLADLKLRVTQHGCAAATPYSCRWDAGACDRPSRSRGRLVGLDDFGRQAEDWLWRTIRQLQQLPERPVVMEGDPFTEEADAQQRFQEIRRRNHVPRADFVRQLRDYLDRPASSPCLVTGPSGIGKTAALADFVEQLKGEESGAVIVAHFVGASHRSASLRDTLGRLLEELRRSLSLNLSVPDTTAERVAALLTVLGSVGTGRRVVVILDAINQLDPTDAAHELLWLPGELPAHVRLIVSCASDVGGTVWQRLQERSLSRIEVGPLTDEQRWQIIRTVPKVAAKTLDDEQIALLLDNPATANPLFLLTALEELRGFGSFDLLNDHLRQLPRGPHAVLDLFEQVFERLEQEFEPVMTRGVLSLLGCAGAACPSWNCER